MKRTLIAAIALAAMHASHAAPAKLAPADLLQKAIQCELPKGKSGAVTKAAKALGGKVNEDNHFALPSPLTVFGHQVSALSISDNYVEEYIAVFKNVKLEEIVAAANLKMAGEYSRQGKNGRLAATQNNGRDVWLLCTVGI